MVLCEEADFRREQICVWSWSSQTGNHKIRYVTAYMSGFHGFSCSGLRQSKIGRTLLIQNLILSTLYCLWQYLKKNEGGLCLQKLFYHSGFFFRYLGFLLVCLGFLFGGLLFVIWSSVLSMFLGGSWKAFGTLGYKVHWVCKAWWVVLLEFGGKCWEKSR